VPRIDYDRPGRINRGGAPAGSLPAAAGMASMLQSLLRTIVKVAVASLIVGTILAYFGITFDVLMKETGVSPERIEGLLRRGVAWVVPNMALGLPHHSAGVVPGRYPAPARPSQE
jgi:hypothetical protein